jgi:hypothetical protein
MDTLFPFTQAAGAHFSKCRRYRYALWREWDGTKPSIAFIGLNPSTANENEDDPTIRRVVAFAKAWGFGKVYMLNLFAWVSAHPEDLLTCEDALGNNDEHLLSYAGACEKIVLAWGAFKQNKARAEVVKQMFPEAYALETNKDGSPKHPLYVRGDVMPKLYKAQIDSKRAIALLHADKVRLLNKYGVFGGGEFVSSLHKQINTQLEALGVDPNS